MVQMRRERSIVSTERKKRLCLYLAIFSAFIFYFHPSQKIISKVENIEQEKVKETIIWNIRKIPYVRSTLTLMGIEEQD